MAQRSRYDDLHDRYHAHQKLRSEFTTDEWIDLMLRSMSYGFGIPAGLRMVRLMIPKQ